MSFWPEPYTGAISLTFDDGMDSHLNFVVPELDRRRMRGTFYLNPRGEEDDSPFSWRKALERWLHVSQAGHEMGNHSLSHPCSLNIQVFWTQNLIHMTLADLEKDFTEAQRRLLSAFPHQAHTSFAYPCYETSVGRGVRRVSYIPLVARLFVAGRARGELRGELANDPLFCDLHCLSSWNAERQPSAFMIGLVEQAVALGRWGIFTFHGIQEGHLPVGNLDFVELLDYLEKRRAQVWVAPVAEIASYIAGKGQEG